MREILMRAFALYFRCRHVGRVVGSGFLVVHPTLVRLVEDGKLSIGHNSRILHHARIVARKPIAIGDDVYIGKNATLVAFEALSIGHRTLIGENVSIHTENHGPAHDRSNYSAAPVVIEPDCWIGAGAVITLGVTIGTRSTIGANSVVTRDVPAGSTWAGNPARPLPPRQHDVVPDRSPSLRTDVEATSAP